MISLMASAQTHLLTGKITGRKDDKPVEKATISVKGGKTIAANDDGSFSIPVPAGKVSIRFNSVGYMEKQLTVAPGEDHLAVVMDEDNKDLNEVVVVGYNNKKRIELTSAVSVVSGKELRDVTSNDVATLLQGKAPGVVVTSSTGDPNASPSVVIRGSSSITAGSDPLTVVDGIIGGTANPNDIESVTILKDAAATGLYGSRASNGVIIITTKRGRAGKTEIHASATVGSTRADEGNYQVMNAQQLYDYQKSFWDPTTFDRDRPDSLLKTNTNWEKLMFHTGTIQNHAISISGGTEKTQVYIAGNYYKEDGTLGASGNEAFNFRTNVTHKINDRFKISIRVNGGTKHLSTEAAGTNFLTTHINMPWDNPYNPDGSLRTGNEPGWLGRDNDNFLYDWQYNYDRARVTYMTGDGTLDYIIAKGLTFSTNNRVSYTTEKRELYYDVRTKAGLGEGTLLNEFTNTNQLITSNRLLYEKSFNRSKLNAIAVLEAEKNYSDFVSETGGGLAPGLHVMSASSSILAGSSLTGDNAYSKGLVQVEYSYDNRFFAVGSGIRESSSRFGANNRAANFYTLGGSWILSNERFMEHQKIFDMVKLRASYGLTGNAQIGNYQTLGLYSFASQYSGNSAAYPFQLNNPFLTWEKAKTSNLGVDIDLFGRISLNVDVYQKMTDALLLNVQLPYTTGFSSVIQNVGSVRNRGLEINLNTVNLKGKFRWETHFNIAFNQNRVMVLDKGKDILEVSTTAPTRIVSVGHDLNSWYMRKWAGVDPANGDPLWQKDTTDANGGKIVTTTNNYNSASLEYVGTFTPKFTGGISNTFSYKGFTLSAFFNFVYGVMVYNSSAFVSDADGAYDTENQRVLQNRESRWQKPGDHATAPKAVFAGNKNSNAVSSRYLQDGSYLRLKNIKFSYDLPGGLLSKVKIASASLFVSADNILTATSYIGRDPQAELSRTGGDASGPYPTGGEAGNYPISKRVLFGINIGL
jgi:TonB-linked SusC/RagA family outer membrane protein